MCRVNDTVLWQIFKRKKCNFPHQNKRNSFSSCSIASNVYNCWPEHIGKVDSDSLTLAWQSYFLNPICHMTFAFVSDANGARIQWFDNGAKKVKVKVEWQEVAMVVTKHIGVSWSAVLHREKSFPLCIAWIGGPSWLLFVCVYFDRIR